jgi:cyclic dehypoxanthinyl futalosine synthase
MGISREQALDCLCSDDLMGMGMEADAVRRRLHPEGVVSYAVGARVCCGALGGAADATVEKICAEIRESVEMGASCVRLAGLTRKQERTAEIERLLRDVRVRFPAIWMEGLSAAEVSALAKASGMGVSDTLARLREAGLDSISAGLAAGAGTSEQENSLEAWVEVHRAAHGLGMRTTAKVTFGASEASAEGVAMEQLVDRLEAVRRLQEETGGFVAFVPVSFRPEGGGTGYAPDEPTAVEYLKMLAVSRMVLDNIENIEANGAGRGLKVLQTGLRFGANDAGWLMTESIGRPGPAAAASPREEDLRSVIRDAGFRPVARDAAYRVMFLS